MIGGSKKLVGNSTADFMIVTGQAGERGIEARYEGETALHTGERGRRE